MSDNKTYVLNELLRVFEAAKNIEKASQMDRYMKNKFSYFGISAPQRLALQKPLFPKVLALDKTTQWNLIFELWDKDQRELQYVAIDILKKWKKSFWSEDDIVYLERLIVSKSWWDTVDLLASTMVGILFEKYESIKNEYLNKWRNSSNIWLIRSTLIFQLKYKTKVDVDLLDSLIKQHKKNKEFFIQKAIGWALRNISTSHTAFVKNCVLENELSGLAKREALRKIN